MLEGGAIRDMGYGNFQIQVPHASTLVVGYGVPHSLPAHLSLSTNRPGLLPKNFIPRVIILLGLRIVK